MTGKQTWVRSGVMWSVGIHLSCIAIIMFFSTFVQHNEIVQIILTLDPSIGEVVVGAVAGRPWR